jgi:hypothetical protein
MGAVASQNFLSGGAAEDRYHIRVQKETEILDTKSNTPRPNINSMANQQQTFLKENDAECS